MFRKLVGIIGSGHMGRDPFDRRSWSTSSYYFFTELQRRDALFRAFGVEVSRLQRYMLLALNISGDRESWRTYFYNDVKYRRALTQEIRAKLTEADFQQSFLQIGAMYDVPSLLGGRSECFSYHDGNLAETLRSPFAPKRLGKRFMQRALDYERCVYQGMTRVFAMSDYLRRSFIDDFGVSEDRVIAVGAGMNLETIPPFVPMKCYESREMLFIGVDFERKGGWELLKAFRDVRQKCPRARLHIVGPQSLTIPPGFELGVEFHGYLSKNSREGKARLDELFRRCSLFVMPSLYEPFGIAPLEAMVNQIPCIVTNGWALKEMVTPGATGDLVECGCVEDLRAKLLRWIDQPEELQRMGIAGRAMALEKYTWERVIDRILQGIQSSRPR